MRIALVVEHYDPEGGGAERSTGQIAHGLAGRGHDVTVLTGRGPDDADSSVRVCPTGPPHRGRLIPPFVRWVRSQLGEFDVSMAVATWLPADVLEPRSGVIPESQQRFLARRRTALGRFGKRVEFGLLPKHRLMRRLEHRQLADGGVPVVVAISEYMKEQLIRHYALAESRIRLVRNGAEMPQAAEDARERVRARFGVDAAAPLFLFVANDPWRKGARPLLEALARLPEEFLLLMAGAVRPSLARLVDRFGLGERVRFAGAARSMADFYAAADATVLPTYYDPASKVVIESLMLGTPAITTAYNGSRDFIDPPGSPLRGRVLSDPDDTEALARAMRELADPEERRRCAAAAASAGHELTMTRHVEELEPVLREVAGKTPKP